MRQAKAEITTKLREKMELAVERLLAALDAIDGAGQDEDREDDDYGGPGDIEDKEPSLGSRDGEIDQRIAWAEVPHTTYDFDLEDEHDGREPEHYRGGAGVG